MGVPPVLFNNFYYSKRFSVKFKGEKIFRNIFYLRPHLVVEIFALEPFVSELTNISATVKNPIYILSCFVDPLLLALTVTPLFKFSNYGL